MTYAGWIVAVVILVMWFRLRKRYRRDTVDHIREQLDAVSHAFDAGHKQGALHERAIQRRVRSEAAILGHKRKKQEREDAMIDRALHGNEAAQ
jgi:hypothetical protein